MVARGEIDFGMANMLETAEVETATQNDLRIIGSIYALRDRVLHPQGQRHVRMAPTSRASACRPAIPPCARSTRPSLAMLATGGLTDDDVKPVMVPNVLRGADDFMAGANDMFMFSFGGPKVREADATVGGVRAIEVGRVSEASRKIFPYGYFTEVKPIPAYVGVEQADAGVQHGLHPVHQLEDEG